MRVQNRIIYIRLTIHEIWLEVAVWFNRPIRKILAFFQAIGNLLLMPRLPLRERRELYGDEYWAWFDEIEDGLDESVGSYCSQHELGYWFIATKPFPSPLSIIAILKTRGSDWRSQYWRFRDVIDDVGTISK